ncbi:MAG TPA: protein-disulfide reductase DsbD domain-containing protein [Opitutaceae bacterium]|jgi:thiol:disulfide interchange protein/DsbC/DsbD-like thiol-disulfide interchange protein|nr:protein-disulfide reductase DsbD domain-containing protein [Opitutaceae bacterium]
MLPRRAFYLFTLAAFFAPASRAAQSHVQASLVATSTSIQPSQPFTVALHLVHEPHWHTYWLNAGTGYATSIAWTLPDGFKAGTIQWPVPIVLHDSSGAITGNGYEGDAFLPVEITPPATLKPGDTVTLRAHADWLMCSEVCVPGKADVTLTLPVSADPPQPSEWAAKLAAQPMPHPPVGWNISAARSGKNLRLRLLPVDDAPRELNAPHFFADDGFIEYDQPQTVLRANGGYEFVLPIAESADAKTARLTGVLATGNPLAGLRIDVPLTATIPDAQASIANAQPQAAAGSGLPGTLVLAFFGGLILNLMPCVFPVLGIKILGFVQHAGSERRKVVAHGLVFALGVLLSFWALAGALAALRASGQQLGWGFQLQSPGFVFTLAALMLVFALNLSGVFEFGLSATSVGGSLQTKSGLSGTFFSGVLATIVATPCSAPFLAPALGAALALPTVQSFIVFTAIALGLSTPYLLLSLFPAAVKFLPRPGAWMETFKQFMAFPLYATVAALIWVLSGQINENSQLTALFGLTVIAMAAWLYGRWHAPGAKPARARFGLLGGAALLVLGGWLGWPQAPAPTDITWEPWSAERVTQLRADHRIIYVDFTARWCATCQANKKLVFHDAAVLKTFHDKKIATLRADWTNADPRITAELARFGRSAVPFDLLYLPGESEPKTLPELLTPGIVLKALDEKD